MKDNQIKTFFHCKQCINALPDDKSPREFAHLEVGWTPKGLQVWCIRHETNVVSIDLMGNKVGLI